MVQGLSASRPGFYQNDSKGPRGPACAGGVRAPQIKRSLTARPIRDSTGYTGSASLPSMCSILTKYLAQQLKTGTVPASWVSLPG